MKAQKMILALVMCVATASVPLAASAGVIYTDANPWPEWTPMYWMHEMLKLMEEDGRFIDRTKLAALREYYLGGRNRYARYDYRGDYRREMLDAYGRRLRLDRLRRDPYLRSSYGYGATVDPYDSAGVDPVYRSRGYSRHDSPYGRSAYRPAPYGRAGYDPYLLPYAPARYGYGRSAYGYGRYRSPWGRVAYEPGYYGHGAYGYDPYRRTAYEPGYYGRGAYGYDPYRRTAYQPGYYGRGAYGYDPYRSPYGRGGYGYYRGYNNAYYPGYNQGYGQWSRRAVPASRYSRNRQTRSSGWGIDRILGNSRQSSPWSGINPMQSWGASNSFNPMNSWNPAQQFNPMNSFNPAQSWNPGNAFNPLNSMNPLGGSPSWMPSTGGNGLSLPWGGSGGKSGSGFNPGSFFQKTSYRYP